MTIQQAVIQMINSIGVEFNTYFSAGGKLVRLTDVGLFNENYEREDELLGKILRGKEEIVLKYGDTYYLPKIVKNELSWETRIWYGEEKDIVYYHKNFICLTQDGAMYKAQKLNMLGIDNLSFGSDEK